LSGAWTVVRVDGRSFSRFTAQRYAQPFDEAFHDAMTRTATAILQDLHGIYAYTESDEISVLFGPRWEMFSREVEKIVSLSAAVASATFTHIVGTPAVFDSRIWVGVDKEQVIDYFRWRQEDAARNALSAWCYWTLRKAGKRDVEATSELHRRSVAWKNELLFQHGINFNDLPLWQRRGTAVYFEAYAKIGFDPTRGEEVAGTRRRVKVDDVLPMKDAYAALLLPILAGAERDIE
jgi:tRNA(His) 5'-end guanylyltransferase